MKCTDCDNTTHLILQAAMTKGWLFVNRTEPYCPECVSYANTQKLRTISERLEVHIKTLAKDSDEKKTFTRHLGRVNRELVRMQGRDLKDIFTCCTPTHDVRISVFEQESCYSGPTSYGTSLGDGNYWRKSGHH
jgi:uncharacterized phage-associated protein